MGMLEAVADALATIDKNPDAQGLVEQLDKRDFVIVRKSVLEKLVTLAKELQGKLMAAGIVTPGHDKSWKLHTWPRKPIQHPAENGL